MTRRLDVSIDDFGALGAPDFGDDPTEEWAGYPPAGSTAKNGNSRLVKVTTALVAVVALVAVLTLALTGPEASANVSSHRIVEGSIGDGQSMDALIANDQAGTADNWDNYIEFFPGNERHESRFDFQSGVTSAQSFEVDVNYRGPFADENTWTLEVLDRVNNQWTSVFTNQEIPQEWVWTKSNSTLNNGDRYLDPAGLLSFRYRSSNNVDVRQLDYVSVRSISGTLPPVDGATSPIEEDPQAGVAMPADEPEVPVEEEVPAEEEMPANVMPSNGGTAPPANGKFDYQIGGDYQPPSGVSIVSRDWFSGNAAPGGTYSICYVNAFQTQPDAGGNRPDEESRWPSNLVLTSLGDDPNWEGEFLIDISTAAKRSAATNWVAQMIDTCAAKGFDAVEFDNLDSWTRLNSLPFGASDAVAYAKLLADYSHSKGLAVGQKNSAELILSGQYQQVGFDFAIAEQCGVYNECGVYAGAYGTALIIIEYNRSAFSKTCGEFGSSTTVVLRDVLVRTPNRGGYVYDAC